MNFSPGLRAALVLLPVCLLVVVNVFLLFLAKALCWLQTSYMIEVLILWTGHPNTKQASFDVQLHAPCPCCFRLECERGATRELGEG